MRESPSYIEVVVLVTKDSVLSVENFTYYCIPKISTWQLRMRVTYLHTQKVKKLKSSESQSLGKCIFR